MTALELLTGIGDARSSYIADAQQFRTGAFLPKKRRKTPKKLWLIAALVALTLLLMGCAVVYALRLQDMQVGQLNPPTASDDGTQENPIALLSLQGANQQALSQWLDFTQSYDPDGSLAREAETSGELASLPEGYSEVYGCTTREMADTLEALAWQYSLNLLSAPISLSSPENSLVWDALGISGVCRPEAQIVCQNATLFPEGTFSLDFSLTFSGDHWQCQGDTVHYRYSRKDCFDPALGAIRDMDSYTQWNYTCHDGTTVLLAMRSDYARLYADLPEGFLSVSMEACTWRQPGATRIPMTRQALEEIAELLDYSIRPHPIEDTAVSALRSQATQSATVTLTDYRQIVEEYIQRTPNRESGSYLLFDLNGDGTEELLINGWRIYTLTDGLPRLYLDGEDTMPILPRMRPCENNILEIYTDPALEAEAHYFYQAEEDGVRYLTGISYDPSSGRWYCIPDDDLWTENDYPISHQEAQAILDPYTPVVFQWCPLKNYGRDDAPSVSQDPYTQYIADKLSRYDSAASWEYLLMDLNSDDIPELITREGSGNAPLRLHTLRDGALSDLDFGSFSYVCEGGILEEVDVESQSGAFHRYSRFTATGVEQIERIVQDPSTGEWGRVPAGQAGFAISEAEAQALLASYHRLELTMHLFSDWPLS